MSLSVNICFIRSIFLKMLFQDCKKPESSSSMVCHSPEVPDFTGNVSQVVAAFILDAVKIQSNLTTVTMIPDPKFIPFEDDVYELKEERLILEVLSQILLLG